MFKACENLFPVLHIYWFLERELVRVSWKMQKDFFFFLNKCSSILNIEIFTD